MESPDKTESSCPSFEILSEYFDGECRDEAVVSHVAVCEHCARTLEELAFIDKAISRALEKNTPADLPQKILAGVRNRLKEEEKKRSRFYFPASFYVRAAALVAVLGMVGYFIWDDYSYRAELERPVGITQLKPSAEVPAGLSAPEHGVRPLHKFGSIDVRELDSASFSNVPVYESNAAQPAEQIGGRAVIPDHVKQVWTVSARDAEFQKDLLAVVQALGIDRKSVRFSRENDKLSLSFNATRMQSVKFVRACRLLGYSLLSPVQPQPEQNRFAGEADSMISYHADFVIR